MAAYPRFDVLDPLLTGALPVRPNVAFRHQVRRPRGAQICPLHGGFMTLRRFTLSGPLLLVALFLGCDETAE